MIVVLSSTNTAFTFEFVDVSGGTILTPTPTSVTIDYITVPTNERPRKETTSGESVAAHKLTPPPAYLAARFLGTENEGSHPVLGAAAAWRKDAARIVKLDVVHARPQRYGPERRVLPGVVELVGPRPACSVGSAPPFLKTQRPRVQGLLGWAELVSAQTPSSGLRRSPWVETRPSQASHETSSRGVDRVEPPVAWNAL
jgi:hypothetical protein